MKLRSQSLFVGVLAAVYVGALLAAAMAAGRPGMVNVPFSVLLVVGIAAYVAWSLWRFFTGRSRRDAPEMAVLVSLMGVTASLILGRLTQAEAGMPSWLVVPFGAAVVACGWKLWAEWRKRR